MAPSNTRWASLLAFPALLTPMLGKALTSRVTLRQLPTASPVSLPRAPLPLDLTDVVLAVHQTPLALPPLRSTLLRLTQPMPHHKSATQHPIMVAWVALALPPWAMLWVISKWMPSLLTIRRLETTGMPSSTLRCSGSSTSTLFTHSHTKASCAVSDSATTASTWLPDATDLRRFLMFRPVRRCVFSKTTPLET